LQKLTRTGLHTALAALIVFSGSLAAQRPDSVAGPPTADSAVADTGIKAARERALANAHVVRWYEPLAVLGGIALTASLDEPVANHFRDHRSQSGQDLADAWAKVATVGVGVVTAGVLAGGLISHNDHVTHAGLRLLFSAAVAGVATEGIKFVLGRERPNESTSAWDFDPGMPTPRSRRAMQRLPSPWRHPYRTTSTGPGQRSGSTAWRLGLGSPGSTSWSTGSATWLAALLSASTPPSS